MSRDYARGGSRRKRPGKSSYIVRWVAVLLLFAAFTIGLVYLGGRKQQSSTLNETVSKPKISKISALKKSITSTAAKKVSPPKFDFYTTTKKTSKAAEMYEVDAATFKTHASADQMKAELAFSGFTANIIPVRVKGAKQYRLTLGPYDNKNSALADLARLEQNKISGKIRRLR